jgi:hypothetical protein
MYIYYVMINVASYMFRLPNVSFFREMFFDGCVI